MEVPPSTTTIATKLPFPNDCTCREDEGRNTSLDGVKKINIICVFDTFISVCGILTYKGFLVIGFLVICDRGLDREICDLQRYIIP